MNIMSDNYWQNFKYTSLNIVPILSLNKFSSNRESNSHSVEGVVFSLSRSSTQLVRVSLLKSGHSDWLVDNLETLSVTNYLLITPM